MSQPSSDLRQLKSQTALLTDQLSKSASKDEALERAIKGAETSMQAMKLTQDPIEKHQLSALVKQRVQQAEDIKRGSDWRQVVASTSSHPSATATPIRVLKEPKATRKLSNQEQILLLKASYLNGFKFPPWTGAPDAHEFELKDGEELFLEMPELPLSEFQEDVLDAWKRPADALPPPSWFADDRSDLGPAMTFSSKIDLVQDAATDCSVVASLCAGVARAEKGHTKILRSVLHPYDSENGRPSMSSSGKYVACLNFNGCYRRVVIDDRLPTSSTDRIIHVVDRHNPGLLWPALVEKAYLKVRGGYDFPGSNSGTDIWILCGWIPEQVFLQEDEFEPEELWRRISNAFAYGDVLVTMGTGKMTCKTERELGLAGEHDYAVLDLKEVGSQRLFLIKNPWCEGPSWRGKLRVSDPSGGPEDEVSANPETAIDLGTNEIVPSSRDLMNADDHLSPGTFWMDLDNVIQHFESIYLNWNPGLFAHRQDVHFAWDLTPSENGPSQPRGRYASLKRHPQHTITSEKGGIAWVLLWRHFQNAVPADATEEQIAEDRYGSQLSGHMSLMSFGSNGRRMLLPDRANEKTCYVDSPQTLLKLETSPGEAITLVPVEQGLPAIRHTFTISAWSNSTISLTEANNRYLHTNSYAGSWTEETAGGNAHSPTYSRNPQYSIAVKQHTNVSILLEAMNQDLNVHFKLVHSDRKRIHSIRNRDIVFDSKEYRRGSCTADFVDLTPGQYVVICSTFEAHQYGRFTLMVESNSPAQVVQLPREDAGMVRLELGSVTFQAGQSKVAALLAPRRLVKASAIVRYHASGGAGVQRAASPRSLVRVSIEHVRGSERRVLVVSNDGEYSDNAGGIRTADIDLKPEFRQSGETWIVLDRMHVNAEDRNEKLFVELFVDQPDAISYGEWHAIGD